MATRAITLTNEWQQVTTGSETVTIQCLKSRVALCESKTPPAADTPFISVYEAVINPKSAIWAKTFVQGSELVILDDN